jgi:hypothetical protein
MSAEIPKMVATSLERVDDDGSDAPSGWTPEQQMAHMLDLCEAQMESALAESDKAVDELIKAFSGLVETTRSVSSMAEQLPSQLQQAAEEGIDKQVNAISKQMAAAVVAFQFYDKLTQRLGHVRYSLSTLAMFICNRSQTSQRDQWRKLFTTLRRLYRTEEERQIFQLMVEGASAEQARAKIESMTKAGAPATGEIEIF